MKVNRVICIYNNKSEKLIEEISVDHIGLTTLKKIFTPHEDDSEMYSVYHIEENEMNLINQYFNNPIKSDFKTYDYWLECFNSEN